MRNDTMNRLRRANPVPAGARSDEALFAAIVAAPGDERLTVSHRPRRRRHGVRIAIALVALTVGVGVAWAAAGGALELFHENPQGLGVVPGTLWDQDVDPSTVVRAAVLPIPRYGDVEFWYADAKQGGWCGAIGLPDGTWAATKGSKVGGTGPGCYPTREQTNAAGPVFVITGFDYYETQIDMRDRGGLFWRVYYGILSTDTPVATVVDRVSGRRAVVHDGKRFAIAVADASPEELPDRAYAIDLVAYDAAGKIVAEEHPAQSP